MAEGGTLRKQSQAAPPFELAELKSYLETNLSQLPAAFSETRESLSRLLAEAGTHYEDLEGLEQRLTVLEERMLATARTRQSEEQLLEARRELDRQLRPYRGKMTADQLTMLEKQFLDRFLFESNHLPRLSLFYMR